LSPTASTCAPNRVSRNTTCPTSSAATVHQISDGTPSNRPPPKIAMKGSDVTGTDCSPDTSRATPATTPMVASVTRNDGCRA
jgi:hypothetical protein